MLVFRANMLTIAFRFFIEGIIDAPGHAKQTKKYDGN